MEMALALSAAARLGELSIGEHSISLSGALTITAIAMLPEQSE
jgi:hypothetical protein